MFPLDVENHREETCAADQIVEKTKSFRSYSSLRRDKGLHEHKHRVSYEEFHPRFPNHVIPLAQVKLSVRNLSPMKEVSVWNQ